jgi:hypothetical protein
MLLAACGSQPPSGAVAPSAPPAATSAPAEPTQAPEASAAPEPAQAPTTTSAPTATGTPAPTNAPPTATATSAPPTAAPARTTASPAAQTPAQAPQPSENSKEALLIVERSGGIVGLTETMIVYADGRLEFSGDVAQTQGQATPDELSALRQLLASPEFAALSSRYTAMGADLIIYAISVPGSGKNVVTMDGAKNPPVLDQLLADLQPLLKRAR